MFNTRFWPMTANPIKPISQVASDMLDPSLFSPARMWVLLDKFRPEGEMIPDHNRGSKRVGATRARVVGLTTSARSDLGFVDQVASIGGRLQFCDQGPDRVGYGSHGNRTHRLSATVHQICGDSAGNNSSPKQHSLHHGSFTRTRPLLPGGFGLAL